jgi:putative DNA primase/helicase
MSDDVERDGDDEAEPYQGGKRARKTHPANEVAKWILDEARFVQDVAGKVYRYTGTHWEPATEATLVSLALRFDTEVATRAARRAEIVSFLKARVHEPDLTWGRVADHEVACRNGVVDVRSGKRRPHRAEDYLERVIPWDFRPGAEAPVWRQCLCDWFGEHEPGLELAAAFQEFAGYALMPHARFKKALLLVGESNTGKSQAVGVLQRLVGTENACALSVEDMDDPKLRAVLKGKALNVLTELPADAMVRDSGFKILVSTEEPVLLDQKYEKTEMYVPTAKHVIATNYLPELRDRSAAMFGRLLLVPMATVIPLGDQDRDLQAKIEAEMEGVLAWAVAGAARLIARKGAWPEPVLSVRMLAEYREQANPIVAFVAERMEADATWATTLQGLTRAFNGWNAGGRGLNVRQVGRMLRDADFKIRKVRTGEGPGGRPLACLVGWRLATMAEETDLMISEEAARSQADEIDGHAPGRRGPVPGEAQDVGF